MKICKQSGATSSLQNRRFEGMHKADGDEGSKQHQSRVWNSYAMYKLMSMATPVMSFVPVMRAHFPVSLYSLLHDCRTYQGHSEVRLVLSSDQG